MSRSITKLPRAESDLIGCYAYLEEGAGTQTADRFLIAVEKTLGLIAVSPGIGTSAPDKQTAARRTSFADCLEIQAVSSLLPDI